MLQWWKSNVAVAEIKCCSGGNQMLQWWKSNVCSGGNQKQRIAREV